jgi:hypothetical protein
VNVTIGYFSFRVSSLFCLQLDRAITGSLSGPGISGVYTPPPGNGFTDVDFEAP